MNEAFALLGCVLIVVSVFAWGFTAGAEQTEKRIIQHIQDEVPIQMQGEYWSCQ